MTVLPSPRLHVISASITRPCCEECICTLKSRSHYYRETQNIEIKFITPCILLENEGGKMIGWMECNANMPKNLMY